MKKYCAVFFTLAMLSVTAFLTGGCGGSSSGTSGVDEAYYEPPNLTEAQLIELARTQVASSDFDLEEPSASFSADASFTAADNIANLEEYRSRRIWYEAANLFASNNWYLGGNQGQISTSITQHPQSDGTTITIRQSRYLYVYRWTNPDYEVIDERLSSVVKQHKYTNSGCQHGVHGTDCVGLIWNAANNAGITLWAAEGTNRRRWGPSTLTTASKWTAWFSNAQDVSSEIGRSKPKPGDIVSWGTGHVGIAAKVKDSDNDRIVIIHCTGKTNGDYTCSEYKTAGETSSTLNEAYPVNGVTAHEYNVNSGITAFGRESKRLRLYVEANSGQQNQENQNQQDNHNQQNNSPSNPTTGTITANSLNGTWTGTGSGTGTNRGITAPVTTELRYTFRNVNEAAGTAEIDIYDRTTNTQYGVDIQRGVNYGNQTGGGRNFSVTHSGTNQWTFHANYSDGEDNITITLTSPTTGTLRLSGVAWDEDNPSDRTTFDITCNITKQ